MTDRARTGPDSREDRLRQALRANLQRRKAQARARAEEGDTEPDNDNDKETGRDES